VSQRRDQNGAVRGDGFGENEGDVRGDVGPGGSPGVRTGRGLRDGHRVSVACVSVPRNRIGVQRECARARRDDVVLTPGFLQSRIRGCVVRDRAKVETPKNHVCVY